MYAAPAFAARSAWFAEKHKVTLIATPAFDSARQALSPSQVSGTLTVTLGAIAAILFVLGVLGMVATALIPPVGVLGLLFIFLAFVMGIAAIVPAAWPWQWNRAQQEQKVTRRGE